MRSSLETPCRFPAHESESLARRAIGARILSMKVNAYATHSPTDQLQPFTFERREVGPRDVKIEILYCGVCHSDLHQAHNDWKNSIYPMVPGHEIVGRVTEV